MMWKIYHDQGGGITEESLKYFERNVKKLGQILEIHIDKRRLFSTEILGSEGVMLLSGLSCGYPGLGPHGSVKMLIRLGIVPSDPDGIPDQSHWLVRAVFSDVHLDLDLRLGTPRIRML